MNRRVLLIILLSVMVGALSPTIASGADGTSPERGTPGPCYVIIAVDVSGGMEQADGAVADARGRRWTLRDEGQLVLLQLLPYVYSDLHVGVCHFSDKVRYTLPSEETGPLLPWGDSYLSEAACRNLVRPAEFRSSFRADIAESLSWAAARIQAARRKHGEGYGKVLLLSHGDPRNSARESRAEGSLLAAGAELARQDIQVYPIIINKASYRPGTGSKRLSSSERAADQAMVLLADATAGKVYRMTRASGFPDIVMDMFGFAAPLAGEDVPISPYDWAVMVVGPSPDSVSVMPFNRTPGTEAVVRLLDDTLETTLGIRLRAISSRQWPATILRRPDGAESVDRFWKGRWTLPTQDGQGGSSVRVYRIPDFILQIEVEPRSPWWMYEQGKVKARLLDRHAGGRDAAYVDPAVKGAGLAIRLTAQGVDQAPSFGIEGGQWTVPARLFASDIFTTETPGRYDLIGELLYSPGDANVPLIGVTRGFQVLSAGAGIEILNATGDRLGRLPQEEIVSLDTEGGRDVSFRVVSRGSFDAEAVAGNLHLEPLPETEWALRKDANGDLTTGPVRLPKGENRLAGWVRIEVQADGEVRRFRLPDFEVTYRPAPTRMSCTFGDTRRALWVGEFHRQLLTLSAFPVFEDAREQAVSLFPETLSGARMRTVELQSGTAQVAKPRGRLVEIPKPTGAKGRMLAATYALESTVAIPRADQCEIGLEGTIRDLQGAVKTYAVVDPVVEGLFQWTLRQEPVSQRRERVPEVVYCGEPVQFSAQWRANQNISAIRFEIARPEPNEPFLVDVPVASGAESASVEEIMPQLVSGKTYPVYVYVTIESAGDAPVMQIKLDGGRFRAEDRRLILEEIVVGTETAKDISCFAWEPARIPLRIVFSGYLAGNQQHGALIERFKSACTLAVTPNRGDVRDVTDSIEWTALTPAETGHRKATRCELQGYAVYMPQSTGRAAVELQAKFSQGPAAPADAVRQALGHLSVRAPRLAFTVQKLIPSGVEPVFDSPLWVKGDGGLFPVTARFSTRLQVTLRRGEQADDTLAGPWDITLQVLRRMTSEGHWVTDLSEAYELSGRVALNREVQITKDGQYALEIAARARDTGQTLTRLRTPVLISIRQHEVEPTLSPPAWITPHVRRWPFAYQVTLHQEKGELSQAALTFQFQLPGKDSLWLDGSIQAMASGTADEEQLLVKGPAWMPALGELVDGAVKFRLSGQGLELLNWEYPNVRVLAPMLGKLAFSRTDNNQEITTTDGVVNFVGSTGLSARPVFRPAPGLAGQWVREQTRFYLWPSRGDVAPGGQGPSTVLQSLTAQGRADADTSEGQVFVVAKDDPGRAVKILSRLVRYPFWGWPTPATTQRYSLAASAEYRLLEGGGRSATGTTETILEWTPVYSIELVLPRVVPWCWWCLAGAGVFLVLVVVLRFLARRPDRLGLDVRLEENVAVIDPAGAGSPIQIELRATTLRKDMELYRRYLTGRWEGTGRAAVPLVGAPVGRLLRPLATVVACATVLIRRCVYPRRWAWALITPKIAGSSQHVGQGLVCVWTSPLVRKGRGWSSGTGPFDLPGEGQARSITLELPYQMGGAVRAMRVGIRITRMASAKTTQAVDDAFETDSELSE